MNKSVPKSDGSSFLLCEDVREEVNDKLSIIGVFPNDDIVLQKDTVVPSIMAVLFARGGEGACETKVSLTDLACTRFRRHRVRCFDGTGGGSWKGGSLHASSSLRQCG